VLAAPRPARLVALVLGLALLAGACTAGGSGHAAGAGTTGGRPILFVGDSLTVGARLFGRLGAIMGAAGWRPEVVAQDGQDVTWGLDQVRRRDRVPPVVVVGLGTNPGPEPIAFTADVRTMVAELTRRGARRVVWWPPGDRVDPARLARATVLRDEAGGRLEVPDWPAALARNPQWLTADGVHLTPTGYRSLAGFLRDQVGDPVDAG